MKSVPQTPKRAVLYARVSTKEQAEKGYSMAQQLDALRSYCKREGIEVVGVYEDPGHSGAYLERPGLDSLRERVAEHVARHLRVGGVGEHGLGVGEA